MNSANPFGYQGAYQSGMRTSIGNNNQVRPGTSALSNGGWYNQPGQFGQYVQQPQPQGGAGPINYLQNQIAQYGASAGGGGLRGGGGAGYYQNQLHSFLRAPFMNPVPDWKKG